MPPKKKGCSNTKGEPAPKVLKLQDTDENEKCDATIDHAQSTADVSDCIESSEKTAAGTASPSADQAVSMDSEPTPGPSGTQGLMSPFQQRKNQIGKNQMKSSEDSSEFPVIDVKQLNPNIPVTSRVIEVVVLKIARPMAYGNGGQLQHFVFGNESGEIQFTLFGGMKPQWESLLQVNSFVRLEGFLLRPKDNRNKWTSASFDASSTDATSITEPKGERHEVKLTPIDSEYLKLMSDGQFVDMAVLVIEIGDVKEYPTCKLRQLTLVDKTGKFTVKLFNHMVETVNVTPFEVILFKIAKISTYNGVNSIDCNTGDLTLVGKDHSIAKELSRWFEAAEADTLNRLLQ